MYYVETNTVYGSEFSHAVSATSCGNVALERK
jgi:hypothetical protein